MAAPVVNLADVQGLVYSGFKRHAYAGFLFAMLGTDQAASRAWLGGLTVTSARRDANERDSQFEIGFSASGRAALAARVCDVGSGYSKLAVAAAGIHHRYLQGKTVGTGFDRFGAAVPRLLDSALHSLRDR